MTRLSDPNCPGLVAALVPDDVLTARFNGREIVISNNIVAPHSNQPGTFEAFDPAAVWRAIGPG